MERLACSTKQWKVVLSSSARARRTSCCPFTQSIRSWSLHSVFARLESKANQLTIKCTVWYHFTQVDCSRNGIVTFHGPLLDRSVLVKCIKYKISSRCDCALYVADKWCCCGSWNRHLKGLSRTYKWFWTKVCRHVGSLQSIARFFSRESTLRRVGRRPCSMSPKPTVNHDEGSMP